MKSLAGSVALVVAGQVAYHLLVRGAPRVVSPFLLISLAYLAGCIIVSVLFFTTRTAEESVLPGLSITARAIGIGCAVSCVEVGYVVAYRRGLALNTGPLTVLALTSLALVPLAAFLYREGFSLKNLLGGILAIIGIWLLPS